MKSANLFRIALALALAGSASAVHAGEIASASITSTQLDPTTWQYSLTLTDTGTTSVGTFWFAWIPGEDFLPTSPTNILSPASWNEIVTHSGASDGYAIQWVATGAAALTPGNSLSGFEFDSTASPTQIAGDSPFFPTTPILTTFTYSAGPFSDAGAEFIVQPAASPVPEPATGALLLCAGILAAALRRRAA